VGCVLLPDHAGAAFIREGKLWRSVSSREKARVRLPDVPTTVRRASGIPFRFLDRNGGPKKTPRETVAPSPETVKGLQDVVKDKLAKLVIEEMVMTPRTSTRASPRRRPSP